MVDLVVNPPPSAFLTAVQALPPRGRAFPPDTDTLQAKVFTPPANARGPSKPAAMPCSVRAGGAPYSTFQ